MSDRFNIIYGLSDPRNDLVMYVGKTTVGVSRPLFHLCNSDVPKVKDWVKSLEDHWVYPIPFIIETVEDVNDLPEREEYWINYYYLKNPFILNVNLVDESIIPTDLLTQDDIDVFNTISSNISNIGHILKKQRIARRISQSDVSELSSMSRSTVSLIEKGSNVSLQSIIDYVICIRSVDMKSKFVNQKRIRNA